MTFQTLLAPRPAFPEGSDLAAVEGLLDWDLLAEAGWDPDREWFRFPSEHPVVGWQRCRTEGCNLESNTADWLCSCCHERVKRGGFDIEEFVKIPRAPGKRPAGEELCIVCRTDGHERPSQSNSLCSGCGVRMFKRGQTVAGYVHGDDRFPPAEPRPSLGPCRVDSCDRYAGSDDPALCDRHRDHWVEGDHTDRAEFCRTADPVKGDLLDGVWLGGLAPLVQAQMLFGVQRCIVKGRQLRRRELKPTCDDQRDAGVVDLAQPQWRNTMVRRFIEFTMAELYVALGDPLAECDRDVWNLRVLGHPGRGKLDFRRIAQPWLRDAAKAWARAAVELDRSTGNLLCRVVSVTRLAEHLERACPGAKPTDLDRAAKERYLAEMRLDEAAGVITVAYRRRTLIVLRQFLRDANRMGWCDAGGPLAGMAGGFHIGPEEIPRLSRRGDPEDEIGRGLPEAVIAQLLQPSNLGLLTPMWRRIVRLAIDTGRRPDELCSLPFDCLDSDLFVGDDGTQQRLPVLIHDQPKTLRRGVRLAITAETAAIIAEQQATVRDRYSDTEVARLALFPRRTLNPGGEQATSSSTFCAVINQWRHKGMALFEAVVRDDRVEMLLDGDGRPIQIPNDPVFAYAFRHTYAQRHIDAGVPEAVLADLMGHSNVVTTQGYYKIRTQQKREALEKVTRYTLTVRGTVMTGAGSSSQSQRIQLGSVGVPMGSCGEPSNVRSHGRACPFRHRCFGCAHFRTDLSHLPDLRAYLNQLLVAREEMADANPDIAEWARRDAMPSDDEINTVRGLIDACEALLDQLPAGDRQDLLRHIETLRETRQHLVDAVPIAFLNTVAHPAPILFPNLAGGSLS